MAISFQQQLAFDHKTASAGAKRSIKRKISHDDVFSASSLIVNSFNNNRNRITKTAPAKSSKRTRRTLDLHGTKLPINRIIETLDKSQLQNLILDLVKEHPKITNTVILKSPNITPDEAINVLKTKLNEKILNNLPYKMDSCSDYSFLRVKPFIDDFFQLLSDYTLNYLPPVENDYLVSLTFIKRFLVEILPRIPNFNAVEYKYFYNITIEKFNHILENNILHFISEKRQNILLIINENWIEEFKQVNELNNNLFSNILLILDTEISNYYNNGTVILTEEDSTNNKLQGLDNLLNFASQNNPLAGSTLGNVYDL